MRVRLPNTDRSATATALGASLLGHGLVRLAPGDFAAARRRPGPVPDGWGRVPPSLLRNSDEQTIAGVAAAFTAMARSGWGPDQCAGWGVVAAPRFLGRASLAQALQVFMAEGVWGTSPHLIPHFALHSPAGTISLALGLHGPNLGVGGGPHSAAEGFLTALTWLAAGVTSGVWLVLTGWSPELAPDRDGGPPTGECLGLALALAPETADGSESRPRFRIRTGGEPEPLPTPLDLAGLDERLKEWDGSGHATIATDPAGALRVEVGWQGDEGSERRGHGVG